jgi:hypothetical protein
LASFKRAAILPLLRGTIMKKLTCVLAILAAASTAAVAKDLKQDKKATTPTVAATQMTDSEMDKVTAGSAAVAYVSSFDGQVYVMALTLGKPRSPTRGAPTCSLIPATD